MDVQAKMLQINFSIEKNFRLALGSFLKLLKLGLARKKVGSGASLKNMHCGLPSGGNLLFHTSEFHLLPSM